MIAIMILDFIQLLRCLPTIDMTHIHIQIIRRHKKTLAIMIAQSTDRNIKDPVIDQ
jgi:hypothetical protein